MKCIVFLLFSLNIHCLCAQTNPAMSSPKSETKQISGKYSDSLKIWIDRTLSNMVLVDKGTYTMGNKSETHDFDDESERPAHSVTVNSFYISKYDVTVRDFEMFVNETGYKTEAEKFGFSILGTIDKGIRTYKINWKCNSKGQPLKENEKDQPVLYVSFNDAVEYCRWLSSKSGKKFRLPTEAEWEFAARGGIKSKGYKYAGSDDLNSVAWTGDNSNGAVHPVGQKAPNELGLYDMNGLVYQWCSDWDFGGYYSISPSDNPKGPSGGSLRVIRGGAWNRKDADFQRISLRHSRHSFESNNNCGFRLVSDL